MTVQMKEMSLEIILSNASNQPIYEQIASQIKSAILKQELKEGEALPSIRVLANDLHVSVITTKRAYERLEEAGFIDTVQGKGTYVAGGNKELLREESFRQVETLLAAAAEAAAEAGISQKELLDMLEVLLECD